MRERHGRNCCPTGFHPERGRRRSRDPQPAAITFWALRHPCHPGTCYTPVRLRRPSPPPVTKALLSSRTRGEGDASAVWAGHRRALCKTQRPGQAAGRIGWGCLRRVLHHHPHLECHRTSPAGGARCEGCDRQAKPVAFLPPPSRGRRQRVPARRNRCQVCVVSVDPGNGDEPNRTAVHLLPGSSHPQTLEQARDGSRAQVPG